MRVGVSCCADLEKVLHYEQSTASDEGWMFMKKTDLYEVWRRADPDHPVHLVKVGPSL